MAHGFKTGTAGGKELNFQVVGNPCPENPKENTLWLDTDVPIACWHIGSREPASPEHGTVWIVTGSLSTGAFNALRKNDLQVYPVTAKQWVDGIWQDVAAMTYRDGVWTDWVLLLFDRGDQMTGFTGGWTFTQVRRHTGATGNTPSVDFGTDAIAINSGNAIVHPVNRIDLTGYSTLEYYGYIRYGETRQDMGFGVWNIIQTDMDSDSHQVAVYSGSVDNYGCLDISALEGEYYVGMFITDTGAADPKLRCNKFVLR